MTVHDERVAVAAQVTVAAIGLLRSAGAFTEERLHERLPSHGWRPDEVESVLLYLQSTGYIVGGFIDGSDRRVWMPGRLDPLD